MKLTKSEAIANHRKMWNWIADETLKRKCKVRKREYFETHGLTDVPRNVCYCCEYSCDESCSDCPIEWGGEYGTCESKDNKGDRKGLYTLWYDEYDYIKAAELARQIAELPERE